MDATIRTAGMAKDNLGKSSIRKMLISAATITVRLDAILTAALARLRRRGGMKSGSSDSAMGLNEFATSA